LSGDPFPMYPPQTPFAETLSTRRDAIRDFLLDNSPLTFHDQTHLDANTPERAYYHYGYMMALSDALTFYLASVPQGPKTQ
jgi:hypothetical protein